jgi:tripartite-type tricarboxylate transporter receptor subunit TctC
MHRKLLILLTALLCNIAMAWQPTKPVTVVMGFAPGSGNEISFRKASQIVQQNNPGVTFVIEHRPGADSVVAHNYFLNQPADGYTIAVPSHMSQYVTNDIWQRDIKRFEYNTFVNVVTLGQSPLALVAHPSSVINTPAEFVVLIKRPGRPVNVALGGGAHQMAYEYIMHTQDGSNQVQAVKHSGPAPAVQAVASNVTEFGIMPVAVARPLIEAGRVRLIGLTGTHNIKTLKDAPLMNLAVPGISVYAGWMVSLLPGTRNDVIEWYQQEFARAIQNAEYQAWATDSFIFTDPQQLTPQGTSRYAEQLRRSFAPIIKKLQ